MALPLIICRKYDVVTVFNDFLKFSSKINNFSAGMFDSKILNIVYFGNKLFLLVLLVQHNKYTTWNFTRNTNVCSLEIFIHQNA